MVVRNIFLYPVLERSVLFRSPLVCSFVKLIYHTLGQEQIITWLSGLYECLFLGRLYQLLLVSLIKKNCQIGIPVHSRYRNLTLSNVNISLIA